jgi:drug/metabolite transporter (DMT)-like permease
VPLSVFLIILLAAALHAGWNAVVKVRLDPVLAMTLITVACSVIAAPLLVVVGLPRSAAWPWIVASIVIHLGYYVFLAQAYRLADMSQVYPIARGAAPLMTGLMSLVFVHDPITLGGGLGIACLAGGVLLISFKGQRSLAAPSPVAILCALATAATICAYTIVDGIGARAAGSAHSYAAALFALDAAPMAALCLWRYGLEGIKPISKFVGPGFAGGAMSLAAYWIVIWAMTVAPIALVAALRETSVLFAGLIAIVVLKEEMTPIRALAASLILAGLAAMRLF